MIYIKQLFTNYLFISAGFSWLLAQFFKVFTDFYKNKSFTWESFMSSGGMPSSHTATVCALTTAAVLQNGVASSEFAISAILALIVMKDAAGVRLEAGKQAKAINRIIKELFTGESHDIDSDLKEIIGHTPIQVAMGAFLGVFISIILYFTVIK